MQGACFLPSASGILKVLVTACMHLFLQWRHRMLWLVGGSEPEKCSGIAAGHMQQVGSCGTPVWT